MKPNNYQQTDIPEKRKRLFLWGLSNGIGALSIAALFWFGLGLGPYADKVRWYVDAIVMLLVYGVCGALLWGAFLLRRRSGFQRVDLKSSTPEEQSVNRKTIVGFASVVLFQSVLVGSTVVSCLQFNVQALMWPLVALIVSLHFLPLGKLFAVRPYYYTGVIGSLVSLSSLSPFFDADRLMSLGIGMGVVMSGSAMYILWKANMIFLKSVKS